MVRRLSPDKCAQYTGAIDVDRVLSGPRRTESHGWHGARPALPCLARERERLVQLFGE